MKQLFIPEIGTEITLAKPWSFKLYGERRNEALLSYFEAYEYYSYVILNKELPKPNKKCPDVDCPGRNLFEYTNFYGKTVCNVEKYNQAVQKAYDENEEYQNFIKEFKQYKEDLQRIKDSTNRTFLEATLPENTTLKIDRIYIRKGAQDYSSITFFARIPGDKKAMRFWAKLEDCNNIIFK